MLNKKIKRNKTISSKESYLNKDMDFYYSESFNIEENPCNIKFNLDNSDNNSTINNEIKSNTTPENDNNVTNLFGLNSNSSQFFPKDFFLLN